MRVDVFTWDLMVIEPGLPNTLSLRLGLRRGMRGGVGAAIERIREGDGTSRRVGIEDRRALRG